MSSPKFRQESNQTEAAGGESTLGQSVPKRRRPKYQRESEQAPADTPRREDMAGDGFTDAEDAGADTNTPPIEEPTLGQSVPKFRRESSEAKSAADKLHREDATEGGPAGGGDTDTPPKGKAKPNKDAARFQKSKLRMEKSGEKLNAAKEKLAAQKPIKKPGPVKKVGRAVSGSVQGYVHAKIFEVEDENVGVEGAHRSELVGEAAVRGTSRFVKRRVRSAPARAVRKAKSKNIRATADYQFRKTAQEHPRATTPRRASPEAYPAEGKQNPVSRLWQKQRLKKQYQKQAREATKQTAKAAGKTTATAGRAVAGFVKRHPVGALIALCCVLLLVGLQSCASAMVTVGNGLVGAVAASTYPSEDIDMEKAEAAYLGLEAELQNYLESYERTHDYDEYHYDLAEIEHDPYVLISILSAMNEGAWTLADVQGTLQMLFDKQYILTEDVVVETRYYTETDTWTDADGNTHTDTYEVPYDYYICTVTLKNEDLSHLPILIMSEEQLSRYALYTATLGNRPDLFGGTVKEFTDYDVPEEYLADETFKAILTEAEKYLGYPYIWGGYNPSTSFDCSGFVSWVINHSGWDVGRLGATSLYNICTPTNSPRPGDLVFFEGTYDTAGMSHCGIYVGDGMMLHCGDPIGYANLNTSYWQVHFSAYGRLP